MHCVCFFFFKQKTAYEMRISDWSSDVCSSDLDAGLNGDQAAAVVEGGDAVERTKVEHAPAGQELLPAHRVSRAHHRQRLANVRGGPHRLDCSGDVGWPDDGADAGRVEARVDVVEFDAGVGEAMRFGAGGKGKHRMAAPVSGRRHPRIAYRNLQIE